MLYVFRIGFWPYEINTVVMLGVANLIRSYGAIALLGFSDLSWLQTTPTLLWWCGVPVVYHG